MPVDFRTHGYDWRKKLRETEIFCALVTPAWHTDPFVQRQYAYAEALGKPIVLLVQQGATLPRNADAHIWKVWSTVEECAALVTAVARGDLRGLEGVRPGRREARGEGAP